MGEINEDSINKLLLSLPDGLNAIERAIMANEGTVQSFLSVLCNTPVKVEVISQRQYPGIIIRWARLVTEDSKGIQTVVCLAESVIHENENENLITMIKGGQKGIGQIINEIGLQTTRRIEGYHNDPETFARTYAIQGDCDIVITEVFNHRTIADAVSGMGLTAKVLHPGFNGRGGIGGTCAVVGPMGLEEATEMLGFNPLDLMQQNEDSEHKDSKSEG